MVWLTIWESVWLKNSLSQLEGGWRGRGGSVYKASSESLMTHMEVAGGFVKQIWLYGMKTNWCHYFIRILLDFYMFRAHRPIFRRVRTAVHTTIGSVSVRSGHTEHASSADRYWNNGCVNSCTDSPEDGPMGPKHVETQKYTNKIVKSVGFHSIRWRIVFYPEDGTQITSETLFSAPNTRNPLNLI